MYPSNVQVLAKTRFLEKFVNLDTQAEVCV